MTRAFQNPNLTAAEQLTQVLRERMAFEYGNGTDVQGLVRLSGGASRETWSFVALKPNGASQSLILKRDPMDRQVDKKFEGVPEGRLGVDRHTEGRLMQLAYEAGGGGAVSREALHFWEVFGCMRWGMICMILAFTHITGKERSIEKVSIGRRSVEGEYDLLQLVD